MAKKKRKHRCDLPPEGLWVDPAGRRFEISEHLMAIKQRPDIFGLSETDVSRADIPQLRDLAVALIESGWMRFRYLDGTWAFEVDSAKRRMGDIEDVLSDCGAHGFERVTISQLKPMREFDGTVNEVFDRTIMRFQENPKKNPWRFSE